MEQDKKLYFIFSTAIITIITGLFIFKSLPENNSEMPEIRNIAEQTTIITSSFETTDYFSDTVTSFEKTEKITSDSPKITNDVVSCININTADIETLTQLKGIGEKKAEKIIEYRNQNNGFKCIEEIMEVSGIGEKTFENIKNEICV